jgi:hypothetical protein
MTASQAMASFKARTLSPVELLEELIERAEEVEPKVNAFSYRHFDQALEKAKRAEARFMKSGDDIRPLEDLPIAVKDGAYIKGMPTSSASLAMRYFLAGQHLGPCGAHPGGGGHHPRPQRHPGVLLRGLLSLQIVGGDPQPPEPGIYSGRIIRRQWGLLGCRNRTPGLRFGYRGLHPNPCLLLWRGGLQASPWT